MRIIAHLDMDAFFAAIEERDNPRFKGRPIVVGADPEGGNGRGVVSTANYAARKYGIHSALPISTAWRLSEDAKKKGLPPAVFVGGQFGKYSAVSDQIMTLVQNIVEQARPPKFPKGNFERASVDEAYLDLSSAGDFAKAKKICEKIKKEIKAKERLTASIGLGPNKLIAKIASDMQKPDGLTVILPEEAEGFLEPLNIRKIPGIGPKTEIILNKLGAKTIKDLKKFSFVEMKELLGRWGEELYRKAHGKDDSPLITEREAKSIGEQETFHEDSHDTNFITERLKKLCESVIGRLKMGEFSSEGGSASGGKTFRTIGITVRFSDFETKTRAHTLPVPANDQATLYFESLRLLMPFLDKRENPRGKTIRLIGAKIGNLK